MASQQHALQHITLVLKPDFAPPPSSSESPAPPACLGPVCAELQAVPGVVSVHAGRHREHPERWDVLARWSSPAALDAFAASAEHTTWAASLKAIAAQPPLVVAAASPAYGDLDRVLAAPCVEIFTAYGVDTDGRWLADRMAPFATAVRDGALPGQHGVAYGQFTQPADDGFGFANGPAVRGFLGWDTAEAHLAQRGEGKLIDNNIHYIREERKQADMYHVYFTQM